MRHPLLAWPLALSVIAAALPCLAISTDDVYEKYAPAVVQVRIVNEASASKKAIGTGFFVDRTGLLITNYHVVSELVQHPKRYHAELVGADQATTRVELLSVDVVHDLAILQAAAPPPAVLELSREAPRRGARLFSLGNPYDLGTSIVEGTHNGLLAESLYEKIHFTGAINPGMSGGPVIDPAGRVVGINVSTAGNALGFLVPVKFAVELLAAVQSPEFQKPDNFTGVVRDQLIRNQQLLTDTLMNSNFQTVQLGPYQLPSRFAPFVKCWGDEDTNAKKPFKVVAHSCSTSDAIFVAEGLNSGLIQFDHRLYRSKTLNRFQFYTMFEAEFGGSRVSGGTPRQLVTRMECESGFVAHAGVEMKMALCLRAYRKMKGLYDAVLVAATVDRNDSGLQTRLEMRGVSFENAELLARRFVEAVRWAPSSS